jgi:Zinc-ribbon containing domain
LSLPAATVEKWVWVLVYGGLIALALGLAVRGRDSLVAVFLIVGGAVLTALGVVLVWVRSLMRDDERQ